MHIKSIIFIGMAGVGKSSIGKMVANYFSLNFIDTDKLIANDYNDSLNNIIDSIGSQKFNEIEAKYVIDSVSSQNIISPGGSFIYSIDIIEKIKHDVVFINLFDEPKNIKSRILNLETRGIVGLEEKSFEELCFERHQLYQQVANIQFNLNHYSFEDTTDQIINYLEQLFN